MHEPEVKIASVPAVAPAFAAASESGKPRPAVVTLIGLPGAGKRVVARALAERLGMRRIDREAIRKAMFPQCSYSFVEKSAAFRAVLLALEINCALGESSVIEGMSFARRSDLLRVEKVIRQYGLLSIPVHLDCSPAVARARIERELAMASNPANARNPEIVAEVRARFDTPPPNAMVINASLGLDDVSRVAVAAVARLRAA